MDSKDDSVTKSEPEILVPPDIAKEILAESFEVEDGESIEVDSYEFPYGKIILTISLSIAVVSLIIIGIVAQAKAKFIAEGLPYWIIAGILSIPLVFYFFNLFRAYNAHPLERKRILNEIPDI
ncbi:unnamed protein product [Blepharisma stoltei]|uniref:Transmembrane protein 230 n=1 Tax=Blepharisma stoltei TaxID=1481888 RepID=A0AAU9JSS4_9CILI|nr:unnamed protein product [Blepharisma stoltei]